MTKELLQRISKHDMIVNGPLTHPFESMHIGNGDIGASVSIFPHELKIVLSKSDISDARSNADPEKYALKHDDLIKLVAEKNRDLQSIWDVGRHGEIDYLVDSYTEEDRRMPHPKRAGCIRVFHPGLSNTKVNTRLRLVDGVVETTFAFAKGTLTLRAFIERGSNRCWVQAESEGETPWVVFVVEKEPDDNDISLPLPVLKQEGQRTASITQTIPPGFGIDEFNWTLGIKFPEEGQWVEFKAWRARQYCAMPPGQKAELCVSVATDRDKNVTPGQTLSRAMSLVAEAPPYDQVLEHHRKLWADFWQTSNVTLADEELESIWYRNHFGQSCALGANPLGSAGNVVIQDSIPWNGDCHMNHNFQKWYCTAMATNHPEWIELYAGFIADKLPIFEYQAQLVFGLEGAYCDISYFTFMAKEHSNIINHVGRALAVTGWVAMPLWQHWQYLRDINWLREKAYPYIKAAAQFYVNYLNKYSPELPNGEWEIFPSIRLEEPNWTKDFIGCRNTITDLCMFKRLFDVAIEASTILDTDSELRQNWVDARSKVPEIEHGIDENGNGWIALDKHWKDVEPIRRADESRYSRWGGGGWIVYPGEYINGDGDDSLTTTMRTMLKKTNLMDPFISEATGENMYPGVPVIHPISSLVPSIRLGLTEQFDTIKNVLMAHRLTYGQAASYMLSKGDVPKEVNSSLGFMWYDWRSVENKYAGVLAITEMLLQSQGGLIRLFPFMPENMDVAFENFRAVGGFIVSAERKQGRISVKVVSECGEILRIKPPKGEEITIKTEIGKVYNLEI